MYSLHSNGRLQNGKEKGSASNTPGGFQPFPDLGPHSFFLKDSRAARLYMTAFTETSWQFIKNATKPKLLLQTSSRIRPTKSFFFYRNQSLGENSTLSLLE
jgi:hypothetical protein